LALVTSLNAPLAAERTHLFLLPLSEAGGDASLPPTALEHAEAESVSAPLRRGFLARRRLLRRALALRLGANPSDILITRDANCAPQVASAREPIFVSLAARRELVAIGISDRPVGVDVEVVETNPPEPAWNILHPRERELLLKQSPQERAHSFLALWCAKEAYLKAIGRGLRREPAEIAIFLEDQRRLRIEDRGRSVRLDEAFVRRSDAHGISAIVACVVLAR
jgi:phosphopantetheinyl transferase